MAKNTNTQNNISAVINGVKFENLTIEQAAALANMANATADNGKPEKETNIKTRKQRKSEKHAQAKETIKFRANVVKMANTAIARAEKLGVTLKLENSKSYCVTKDDSCKWAWLRCVNDKLTHENGEKIAAALPKGWEYSPRRNAIRRVYEYDIRTSKC